MGTYRLVIGHRQRQVLLVLDDSIPRTVREVADHIHVKSNVIYALLKTLTRKGLLKKNIDGRYQIANYGLDIVSMIGKEIMRRN